MTIAVTTPTGHVGSRVVQLLVQAGVRPTLLLRDPDKLEPEVHELTDPLAGDLFAADYVTSATRGVDTLLWVVPESFTAPDPVGDMSRLAAVAAHAVRANRISRVVLISSVGAEKKFGAGMIDGLARNEEALAETGADLLVLRCGYYFTNLLGSLDDLRNGVLTTTMPADRPMPWVAPRDVGEIAAARLLAADWTGQEVRAVHGPADLSWNDVATILTRTLGREVRVQEIADDDLREGLRAAGLPEGAIEGVVGMTAGLRDDFAPEQKRDFRSTTPTTLASFAADEIRHLL